MGRKWDPAVSRVGIGRTAALRGRGGWKAGARSVGVLSLSYELRADYCICVAAAAHKMASGRRRGQEEAGGPPGWGGKLGCPTPASARLTAPEGRVGRRARTVLQKEPPDAVALGRGTRSYPLAWPWRPLPHRRRACRERARPDSRSSRGEGAPRRE